MAEVKKTPKSIKLDLTPEQIEEVKKAFGEEFGERLKSLEVDQIAGYLRSVMVVN